MPGSRIRRRREAKVEEGLRGGGERGGRARHPLGVPGRTPGQRRLPSPRASAVAAPAGAALGRLARAAGAARRMCCLTLRPRLGSRSSGSQRILSAREPGTDGSSGHPSPRPGPRPPRPAPLRRSALGSPSPRAGLCRRGWRRPRLVANRDLRRSSLFLRDTQDSPKLLQTEELQ